MNAYLYCSTTLRTIRTLSIRKTFSPHTLQSASFRTSQIRSTKSFPNPTGRAIDINTNVPKDVILFKYENTRFFKFLNIFALCQFGFWSYLAHFAFTTLRDAPVQKADEDAAWYRKINLGDNKYRNSITACCFVLGYGILAASWLYTLRSVRFLVLKKGGEKVSIVTYGPFGKNRIMDVPIKCISAQESRETARVQLPLKVQNRSFFYLLDMRGEFTNTRLYDHTAGLRRKL